jgi:hypothetical protein
VEDTVRLLAAHATLGGTGGVVPAGD